jgi:glyceraldehyde-3-phosphate dehydrogenase (NADP+)
MATIPFLLAGNPTTSNAVLDVVNPYTLGVDYSVYRAEAHQLQQAATAAQKAQESTAHLTTQQRYDVLRKVAEILHARRKEFAHVISRESGKPIKYARIEAERAEDTFQFAADYLRSERGELLNMDLKPGLEETLGLVKRFPAGPVLAIAPFNYPLNLVAHKLAPAIMAGNPFVLKPASSTPLTAIRLGEVILQAGYPSDAVSVVPSTAQDFQALVSDDRFAVLTFTGSPAVGWNLKRQAGRKRVVLELGGDAAAIICRDAPLALAAQRCAEGAFAFAGQICISVQRIVVEEAVYDEFRAAFMAQVSRTVVGDPLDPNTVCGPIINAQEYERLQGWIQDAGERGATLSLGGEVPEHRIIRPTVIENLPSGALLHGREAFGPIVELVRVRDVQEAFDRVNDSPFGLQAGIFTRSEAVLKQAFHTLNVGGVIANHAPTFRLDNMPYGGVKDSGFGREGLKYAYEDMTEQRLLVW